MNLLALGENILIIAEKICTTLDPGARIFRSASNGDWSFDFSNTSSIQRLSQASFLHEADGSWNTNVCFTSLDVAGMVIQFTMSNHHRSDTVLVQILGMPGWRATQLPDLYDCWIYTIVGLVTQVRVHCRSDKSRLAIFMIYGVGCFFGFSDDVIAAKSIFSSACTSISEVKTHSLRTSVSFLLHVTSSSIIIFFLCSLWFTSAWPRNCTFGRLTKSCKSACQRLNIGLPKALYIRLPESSSVRHLCAVFKILSL